MNVLEKILEEIGKKKQTYRNELALEVSQMNINEIRNRVSELKDVEEIIRSYMDDVPDNNAGWIPVSERLPEEGKEVLAQFAVRVVHTNNEVDEFVYIHTMYYENEIWKSFAGVPNGKVEAWQPLPEPYKEE